MSAPSPSSSEKKDADFASLADPQVSWDAMVDKSTREIHAQASSLDTLRRGMLKGTGTLWWLRAAVVSLAFLGLSVFVWQQLRALPAPTPAELDKGRRAMLALVDEALVEHVLAHNGAYPQALGEVLPLQTGVEYSPVPGGYELSVQLSDGQRLFIRKP